jgi:hypothetical protein
MLGSDVYPVIEQLSRPAFLGGASAPLHRRDWRDD